MPLEAHPGQTLAEHLLAVSARAKEFARRFDAADHGELAGLLHDLGKAEGEFQKRIRSNDKDGEKQPHAHHGAAMALSQDVWPVAFAVNGHHAGLHDRHALHSMNGKRVHYVSRAQHCQGELEREGFNHLPAQSGPILPLWLDRLPITTAEERTAKLHAVELYTRFLFSALVDADRLDTERSDKATKDNFEKRHGWRFGETGLASIGAVEQSIKLLENAIAERRKVAEERKASKDVLDVRAHVLNACEQAAKQSQGVFSLTVPTGGGKTLASLAFALHHIREQNLQTNEAHQKLRRVIIVIPYLSIIQQTAKELKQVFGEWDQDGKQTEAQPVVLEHHSQFQDPEIKTSAKNKDTDGHSRIRTMRQLAAENWDAPVVVTTSVQFFDSLFSRRPADARKLHNIAQSVIIFDEVQTFPPRLMQPILDVLSELTNPERRYGCSLVLCTATQPALSREVNEEPWAFEKGRVRPIVPSAEADRHFRALARVSYDWHHAESNEPITWDALAQEVTSQSPQQQGLVVVNTRRQARQLFDNIGQKLNGEGKSKALFHLSTWMTPAHRVEVLAEVNRRLKAGEPCLLVSTQCIEAGVDVDFPAVWRAFGPYDSIVQAAGRCNRNGKLKQAEAIVRVFCPEGHDKSLPQGVYQTATNQTGLLRRMNAADPHNPESFPQYFRLLYQLSVPDECEIQKHREQLHFEQVHDCFDFIEAFTVPVLVVDEVVAGQPCATPAKAIYESARQKFIPGSKERGYFTREDWRAIQPFIVNLDYRNKAAQIALARYAQSAFDDETTELRIWNAGSGGYVGGLKGTGIMFNPQFDQLLSGGL